MCRLAASGACVFFQDTPTAQSHVRLVCVSAGTGSSQVHLDQRTERIFVPSQSFSKISLTHHQCLNTTNGPLAASARPRQPGPQVGVGLWHQPSRILIDDSLLLIQQRRWLISARKGTSEGPLEANCWSSVYCMTSPGH